LRRACLGDQRRWSWVVGDTVDGADHQVRRTIERHGRGYVLTVTSSQRLGLKPVADWLEDVPAQGWRRLSAGNGAKGPRLYDWAWLPCRSDAAPGWRKGLLVRRPLARPDDFTFYLTLSPEGTSLAELVRVAGMRWAIEACFPPQAGLRPAGDPGFEAAKGEVGLDHYEVRSWKGWHRHVTLAMLAHAYLAVVRKVALGGRGGARLGFGPAAPHRARAPQAGLAPDLGAAARSTARHRLVDLAPVPPATRPPGTLAPTNPAE
jgi:SRSO17 transposase